MKNNKNRYRFYLREGRSIKNVIKKNSVNITSEVSIGGKKLEQLEEKPDDNHKDEIEPIIENDEVVGIIHHCQCGKATEIRFDY